MPADAATHTVDLTRRIEAPADIVFRAFLEPEAIRSWFGPDGWRVTDLEMSPVPGGRYRFVMSPVDGSESIVLVGGYREIEPFDRLVFTFRWESAPEGMREHEAKQAFPETVVTVTLRERDGVTELRLVHEGLPTPDAASHHTEGWTGTLDCLVDYTA